MIRLMRCRMGFLRRSEIAIAAILATTAVIPAVTAQETGTRSEQKMQVFHINPVRHSKPVEREVGECLKDRVCGGALSATAAWVGVRPDVITIAKGAAIVATNKKPKSADTKYTINPPKGYKVCKVNASPKTVLPASGPRAAKFKITPRPSGVSIETWTPRRRWPSRRSLYDGYVSVVFVPSGSSRQCGVSDKSLTYSCEGKPCSAKSW